MTIVTIMPRRHTHPLLLLAVCAMLLATTILGVHASTVSNGALQPESDVSLVESESRIHLPHTTIKGKQAAAEQKPQQKPQQNPQHAQEKDGARCPTHYIWDAIDEDCKCPTGTSGMPRASPVEAMMHEVAVRDHRCCLAMNLPSECTVPCCFCIETVLPWLAPGDCQQRDALRQVAWWRQKKSAHDNVSQQVKKLRDQLEQAKKDAQELDSLLSEPVSDPIPAAPAAGQPNIKKDVKSQFMRTLIG